MNKILLSIKPEHVVNILNGKKTIEIRKYIPKCKLPCEVYIYCCKAPQTLLETIDVGEEVYGDYRNDTGKKIFVKNYKYWFTNIKCVDGKIRNVVLDLCGKVVAKFTLNKVETIKLPYTKFGCSEWVGCEEARTLQTQSMNEKTLLEKSCLEENEIYGYLNFKNSPDNVGYAWHIDNLVIFDKPKQLSEYGVKRAPQSYCYLKGERK